MYRFAPLFVIFAAALWGIDGIILTPSLYTLPVPFVVFVESSIVVILLSPILIKRIEIIKNLTYKDWIAFFGVAVFGGAIGTMSITKALFYVNYVNLSIVILIQKLQPMFALALAAVILKERLTKLFFFWSTLSILGAYLMTFGANLPNLATGDKTALAALFALLAAFGFGFSTVLSKRALRNVNFELGTYLRFFFTAIILLIIVLSYNQMDAVYNVSQDQAVIFLIIAFTTGGPAIFLYYYGLKRIKASTAAICELAMPLTAVILEYFIHDKILDGVQWIGVIILIYGIYKVTKVNSDN